MRDVSPVFAARLQSGATTLCHVWKLTRRDGVVMGFTDHDGDLLIDGVIYAARCGFDAAETERALGLSVAAAEVAGALSGDAVSEVDLANGVYDGARVERQLVDWSDPAHRLTLDVHDLGEVRRTQDAFVAELRGLSHHLDQEVGRLYSGACSAEFGDARCGLSAAASSSTTATLAGSTASRLRLVAPALSPQALAWGVLTIASGAQAGARRRLRACRLMEGALEATLWTPLAGAPETGAAAVLTAGCDRTFATCRDRFANAINFRGFPHIPGADYVLRYAAPGDANADGGLAR